MGITGLLPFLEHATKPCHISEFRGATCVIDAYCWLHKGANACALQLVEGLETRVYVHYCMRYVRMLQSFDIRPILVFDGKNLPAKVVTDSKRRDARRKAKQRAVELLRLGKTEEANSCLKQAINVTPDMASAVIKECHKLKVDCIVAPYESDAQLSFFSLKGIAELVITEDSDLILFGCTKVMFKLDIRGCGYLVDASKIPEAIKFRPDKYTFDKFRYMCILSGCDYIESLHGIGLKKAEKFIKLTDETDPEKFLDKLPRYLNMRHLQITDEYKENFMMADATFRHQIVFDPFKRKLVPLTDPEVCGTNPRYCENAGKIFDHETAYQVALGNLHPTTLDKLDNWTPNLMNGSSSIWSENYQPSVSRKEQKKKWGIKEAFSSTSKVEEDIDEQIKIEEDLRLTKELEFYSRKTVEITMSTKEIKKEEKDEQPEPSVSKPSSPILARNPFLVRNRLSNIDPTTSDGKKIVKSRYFSSSTTEVKLEVKDESTLVFEDDDTDVENIPIDNNKGANLSNDSILEELTEEVVDLTLEGAMSLCDTASQKAELCTQKPKSEENNSLKRKKLGTCRPVGLKRSKSGNQHTLYKFFERINKN